MLELTRISKSYGTSVAVDQVDLAVEEGEFVTLLGPSGSGKSTILGMLAGYLTPDSGSIVLNGRDLTRMSPAERGIGIVFQHYALFPHMTLAENIGYGLKRRRWPRKRVAERVEEMLSLIGLAGFGGRRPSQLSGGQQQRVALARALAFEPKLLLMDEPLGALDKEIRSQMQSEIRRIHAELAPTVVYVTHDKEEAYALSNRIGIMRAGRLDALGSPGTLYREPRTAWIASFFGGHQLLDVDVLGQDGNMVRVRLAGQEVDVPHPADSTVGPDVRLTVPVECVSLAAASSGDSVVLKAKVRDLVYMGARAQLHCVTTDQEQSISADLPSKLLAGTAVGDQVELAIDPTGTRLVARD